MQTQHTSPSAVGRIYRKIQGFLVANDAVLYADAAKITLDQFKHTLFAADAGYS
jgi:hypothetical protein